MRRETACIANSLSVGLMTKYWEIGKVKTRLGASIGMRRAARIHQIFVRHLCVELRDVGTARLICLAPIARRSAVTDMLESLPNQPDWNIVDQGDGDLGERMQRWFKAQLAGDQSRAILIGADCPTITPELIQKAWQRLQDHDIVIGPAADGGYYLIGTSGSWSELGTRLESLFHDIPWSTPEVLKMTKTRANEAGLSLTELETMEDVDTIRELDRLVHRLGSADSSRQHRELNLAIEQALIDANLADSV